MFNRDVIKVHYNRDSLEYTNKQNNNEFPERTNSPSRWMKTEGSAHPPPREIELNQLLVTTCVMTV